MKLSYLILLSALYSCSDKPATGQAAPAPELQVLEITSGNTTTYQQYPASIEGATDIEIRPQVSGTIEKLFIEEGAHVVAGTPLFKINEAPYREKLNNAKANLSAAKGALSNAALEVEKIKPLVANKVISGFQLKTAQATLDIAKANVEQAKADIAAAQINIGYTIIKAPVSGYIGRLRKKEGALVGPSDTDPLTQLSDVSSVHVYFSLSENDFTNFKEQYAGSTLQDKIKNLPPVTLLLSNNTPYNEKGRLDVVDGQFDNKTGAITLRANFPNPKGLLRSGNTGRIQLGVPHNNSMLVPQTATLEMQDKVFVFLLDKSNKVKKQPVVVSGKTDLDYVISEGLQSGDRIVLENIGSLQEGTLIKPATKKLMSQK